jgi:hypothetical protein
MSAWPKSYAGENAPPELLVLARQLVPLLLSGRDSNSEVLRRQYGTSRITEVTLTGVGFYIDFEIALDAVLTQPLNLSGGSVFIEVEGVPHGAGCVLFVRDGRLDSLEGFTYGGEWPERFVVKALTDVKPLTPG